ncbi:MAG: class I SAM-dependent methyltransferase [Nanoarchaeota archaeon]|nr:class I SAM-dependent methyltransferase [Nanoarchaeota archaeon]
MDERYEIKNQNLEEVHWWFITRQDISYDLISKLNKNAKILEIGCSGGPLIKILNKNGFKNVYGLDISKRAINLCKKRGLDNVFVRDAVKTKFKNKEFDLIIASDVLEHIKNDKLALVEWNRILKPGGKLIVFVPAFKSLWSPHDETNFHQRRYSKSSLVNLFKKADFKIIKSSYWNFSLFPIICTVKILQRSFVNKKQKIPSQLFGVNRITNKFLISLIKLENKYLKKFNFPWGISVFVVGEKN